MSSQDNPFGALDKMLFASTPPKKGGRKAANENPSGRKVKTKRSKQTKRSRRKLPGQAASQAKTHSHPQKKTKHIPLTDQSTDRSTSQSTNQLAGRVVNRPVAFYIPELIHKKIDEAVRYYQEKHSKKVDRSAVVSAVLGDPNLWTTERLDQMTDKVIDQLTNRLTSRLSS